jgi:hypothetical protein
MAPFNDPSVGPVTVTDNSDTFKAAISSLSASGGGDCPELAMAGMMQGLGASDDGGDLFMFSDASAKDSADAGSVSSLSASKDIKVFPLSFGSCSPVDPGFIRVAAESGGQLFVLARSEAGNITRLADAIVRSNAVDLLSIRDTVSGTARNYTVPIDSTLTKITFSVSGVTGVTITRPNGAVVNPTDPDVTTISLTSGMVFSVASPAPGNWTVTVTGPGDFSLLASGEGTLSLRSFEFVESGGRPGHEGFSMIAGLPLAGQLNTADAVIDGDFGSVRFELHTTAGALLQDLSLVPGSGLSETPSSVFFPRPFNPNH